MKKSQLKQLIKECIQEVGIPIGAEKWGMGPKKESRDAQIGREIQKLIGKIDLSRTNIVGIGIGDLVNSINKLSQELIDRHGK